ncbi:MAG: cofactor-independent phosphoglycerate mutase [Deltaproteobacteria bacterium]|nr:cofactor-independent phosphoglycerate mutase [Deltaproteobacteria bacterium]
MNSSAAKYLILVGDGMGDEVQKALDGKTPLEAAKTPHMDGLASRGILGLTETIAPHQEPGSDVANMAILGYDPDLYHTGRAPLEAASMGVNLSAGEVAFRCNLVTVEINPEGELILADYSAGHISSENGRVLIAALQRSLGNEWFHFYAGVSYRHLLVWRDGRSDLSITPPHDVTGQPVAEYWQAYNQVPDLRSLMESAREVLGKEDLNRQLTAQGKRAANAIWLWGQGIAPVMPSLNERFGIQGVVISAVDLLKGLGICAGLEALSVPGATGYLDTNYKGKVSAALDALQDKDFVYLHVEAPDEASHEGNLRLKIEAIEAFDAKVVGPIIEECSNLPHLRIMVITDHLTPIRTRTHAKGLVPFAVCDFPAGPVISRRWFAETSAAGTGLVIKPGHMLMDRFIKGDFSQGA